MQSAPSRVARPALESTASPRPARDAVAGFRPLSDAGALIDKDGTALGMLGFSAAARWIKREAGREANKRFEPAGMRFIATRERWYAGGSAEGV